MAFSYKVKPRGGDIHDTSPYWFAAFVRFETRDTFSRVKMFQNAPNSSNTSDPVEEQEPLIVDNDVIGWQVSQRKAQHVAQCSLTLENTEANYAAELASGDWMGFWAFDNRQDFERVRSLVYQRKPANGFFDGIKFLGRVDTVRRTKRKLPTGQLQISYNVTGHGFSEFDSMVYYNPYFVAKYGNDALLWMLDWGGAANNLILGPTRNKGLISSQEAMPKLLRICLGIGDAPSLQDGQSPLLHTGRVNNGYLVPATIGRWMGVEAEAKSALSYPDLLRSYIGVQSYEGSGVATRKDESGFQGFVPFFRSLEQNVYYMQNDLTGEYRVLTMHYQNPFWTILQTYLNEPIDEMYTTLRVDSEGRVRPSLIVRQNPLSTNWFAENAGFPVTAFTSLPRWDIDPGLVIEDDVGRSNAMRFNYLHFKGQDMTGAQSAEAQGAVNFVRAPPIVDVADANRSGLRMYEKQLSANVNEAQYNNSGASGSPGDKWQKLMADILMGSHLKYTGTLVAKGIQEPICIGDNLQYEDVIFHIEGVTHSGSISQFGPRDFTTTFELSNGVALEEENNSEPEVLYPDLDKRDEDDAGTVEMEMGNILPSSSVKGG